MEMVCMLKHDTCLSVSDRYRLHGLDDRDVIQNSQRDPKKSRGTPSIKNNYHATINDLESVL